MIKKCRKLLLPSPPPPPPPHPPHPPQAIRLSPALIASTISLCPSDSLSLSFFLWSLRQPRDPTPTATPTPDSLLLPPLLRLTRRFPSLPSLLARLHSLGCSHTAHTLLTLLRLYWRAGMFSHALHAFDEMRSRNLTPNTFARNVVLDILFKSADGPPGAALRFFRETPHPNFLTYNIALRHLCGAGDWRGAKMLAREMVGLGFRFNEGSFLMVSDCLKKGRRTARELVQLLGFMVVSGFRPSVEVWTVLIDGLCQAGEVDRAWDLLGKMADSGCSPSVVTYTALIRGLFEAGQAGRVFSVLELMLSRGCSPDLVLYNVLIDSLSKEGRYGDAIDVFVGLRQREIAPDAYTLSSLMSVLCSSGKLSLLPSLIGGLFVPFDLIAYNSMLNVLCKAGFPSEAVKLYDDMVARGFCPDSYSYAGLLNGLCKLKGTHLAVNVYRAIVANDPNVDAYVHSAVFGGLVRRRKYHLAIKLFREAVLENYSLDVVSYTIAIHGLLRRRRFEEACSLFDQMKEIGVIPNVYTYNVMLRGLCKTRDIGAVNQLLRKREIDGIEMDSISFNAVIGLLLRMRRFNSAFVMFMEMCDNGVKPNKKTYSLLYKGVKHIGPQEADDLYPRLIHYFEDDSFVDISSRISFTDSAGPDEGDDLLACSGG